MRAPGNQDELRISLREASRIFALLRLGKRSVDMRLNHMATSGRQWKCRGPVRPTPLIGLPHHSLSTHLHRNRHQTAPWCPVSYASRTPLNYVD